MGMALRQELIEKVFPHLDHGQSVEPDDFIHLLWRDKLFEVQDRDRQLRSLVQKGPFERRKLQKLSWFPVQSGEQFQDWFS